MSGNLKSGFTTGSCAAATVTASVKSLLVGEEVERIKLLTPKGIELNLEVEEVERGENTATYAIRKYSGDDPDVTNGTLILGRVDLLDGISFEREKNTPPTVMLTDDIILTAGEGVGVVTRKGLACDVGEPAINPTPRNMIRQAVENCLKAHGVKPKVKVTVSIPEGRELALKTFNPKLGIVGGISVLGTSGIVEPMSEQALIDTICVELRVCRESGSDMVVITPGNYGRDYLRREINIEEDIVVKVSNFLGEAIGFAGCEGFKKIALIGHLGKFIKLAGGVLNTHSKYGDERMNIMSDLFKKCGGSSEIAEEILNCVMVDDAMRIIDENGLKEEFMKLVISSIEKNVLKTIELAGMGADTNGIKNIFELSERAREKCGNKKVEAIKQGDVQVGIVVFSNKYGLLGESEHMSEMFG